MSFCEGPANADELLLHGTSVCGAVKVVTDVVEGGLFHQPYGILGGPDRQPFLLSSSPEGKVVRECAACSLLVWAALTSTTIVSAAW